MDKVIDRRVNTESLGPIALRKHAASGWKSAPNTRQRPLDLTLCHLEGNRGGVNTVPLPGDMRNNCNGRRQSEIAPPPALGRLKLQLVTARVRPFSRNSTAEIFNLVAAPLWRIA